MSKCKICGAEVDVGICPFCGNPVSISKPIKEPPKKEEKINENPMDILSKIDQAKTALVEKCRFSVVKIYCEFRKYLSTGSGFVVDGDLIITNAHVITSKEGNYYSLFIEYSDDLKLERLKKCFVDVLYKSVEDDIAILKPTRAIPTLVPRLKLHEEVTKQGESVFTIGNPLHYRFTYIEGSVANPEYKKKSGNSKYSYLQTTLTLNSGNSGGPVFNMAGEVVGMSTFNETKFDSENNTDVEISGYGFCVSAKAIKDAISSIK